MTDKKDNIWTYALIGTGYLLFCSAIPSSAAIGIASAMGTAVNNCYVPLCFVTGMIYTIMVFSYMREKMDWKAGFSGRGFGEAILAAVILFIVINFVVSPAISILFPASAGNYDANVADMMSTPVVTFFHVAIVAPLFEELIFRGLILKRALRKWSVPAAVVMTAVLFGVLHMNLVQGISATAAGIVLCMFYVRRKSVGLNIIAHGIYNGLVFGLALWTF